MSVEQELCTVDGVRLSAVLHPAAGPDPLALCFVVVHGFTNSWRTPRVQRVIDRLANYGAVIAIDMRGHGASEGSSTVGQEEPRDVDAAVARARELGYRRVVTVGFSLGGSTVIRQAAEGAHLPDAVVSVSAAAFWNYRGTSIMRLVHHLFLTGHGRMFLRYGRGTRITSTPWPEPWPDPPHIAAQHIAVPLLVVHGDRDHYFPVEHAQAIVRGAQAHEASDVELRIVSGMAHAESGIDNATLDGIGQWARDRMGLDHVGTPVGWSRS